MKRNLDYQILIEADFLVNLYEDNESAETLLAVRRNIFRTESGTRILDTMFGIQGLQLSGPVSGGESFGDSTLF